MGILSSALKGFREEGGKRKFRQMSQEIKRVARLEKRLENQEKQTEREEMKGADPSRIRKEIDYEVQEAEEIAERLDTIEENMWKVLEGVKEEEEYVIQEEREIDDQLSGIEGFLERTMNELKDLKKEFIEVRDKHVADARVSELNRQAVDDLQAIKEGPLDNMEKIFGEEEEIDEEISEVRAELEALKDNSLPQISDEIEELEVLLEEQETEERKEEELSERAGDEDDFRGVQRDEKGTKKIEKEVEKLRKHRDRLEQKLEKEINQLRKMKEYEERDFEETEDVIGTIDYIRGQLDDLRDLVDTVNHGRGADVSELESAIDEVEQGMESLEKEVSRLS